MMDVNLAARDIDDQTCLYLQFVIPTHTHTHTERETERDRERERERERDGGST